MRADVAQAHRIDYALTPFNRSESQNSVKHPVAPITDESQYQETVLDMKLLFDFFPVVLFYIVYNILKQDSNDVHAMIIATAVLMAATVVQVLINWFKHRKVENMHIVVLVLALLFGGATIYFQDKQYLIWKVTLVNWLFAAVFLGSHFIGDTPIIKRMMQKAVELPEMIWNRLSYMWIGFFFILGVINLLVARHVNFDTWVDFKLFGLLGLTLLFVVLQAIYLSRHATEIKEQ